MYVNLILKKPEKDIEIAPTKPSLFKRLTQIALLAMASYLCVMSFVVFTRS
jgi:hypothetical protein